MRRWIFWLLVAIFFIFFVRNAGRIEDVVNVILSGQLTWLGIALILQAAYYLLYTRLYQSSFALLNLKYGFWEVFPYVLASLAINIAAPTGGAASTLLFMDHARHKNESVGAAIAGTLLVFVIHLGVSAVVIAGALGYLSTIGQLERYQLIATMLFLIFVLCFLCLFWLGTSFPKFFHRILIFTRRIVNRIGRLLKKDEVVTMDWLDTNLASFIDAGHAVNTKIDGLRTPFLSAVTMHAVNALSLLMVFLAFGVTPTFTMLLVSYAMSQLFMIVSPTPQGIGVVEGIMSLALGTLGLDGGVAAVIAIAYRGVAFWIPLAVGAVLLKQVRSFDAIHGTGQG
jgi:uncharacterized protein (TIRG00374 family)